MRAANSTFGRQIGAVEREVLSRFDTSDIEQRFDDLVDSFESDVEALQQEASGIWAQIAAQLEVNAPRFDIADLPAPRPATPPEAPLFDSKRSYLEQMDHYRNWQGRER